MNRLLLGLLAGAVTLPAYRSLGEYALEGHTKFNRADMRYLPAGEDPSHVVEAFYTPGLLGNADLANFAYPERKWLNSNSDSVYWSRFYLNGADISNPAHPGSALITLPNSGLSSYRISNLLTPDHDIRGYDTNWIGSEILGNTNRLTEANLWFTSRMGGPTFKPEGTLDREPANDWGAPRSRRGLLPSLSGSILSVNRDQQGQITSLFAEATGMQRRFLAAGVETSWVGRAFWQKSTGTSRRILAAQYIGREKTGAEWNEAPRNLTATDAASLYLGWQTEGSEKSSLKLGQGVFMEEAGRLGTRLRSLDDEANLGPLSEPGRRIATFTDASFHLQLPDSFRIGSLTPRLISSQRLESLAFYSDFGRELRTHNGIGADVTETTREARLQVVLGHIRPVVEWTDRRWKFWAGGMAEAGADGRATQIARADLVGGLRYSGVWGEKGTWYIGAQHEAVRLTTREIGFLSDQGAVSYRYTWNDNGDGVYTDGERGALLQRGGGRFRGTASGLQAPVYEELAFGFARDFHQRSRWLLNIGAKVFRDTYSVRYADNEESGYDKVSGGAPGQDLYNRVSGFGTENYNLTNRPFAYSLSANAQIIQKETRDGWFLNISAKTVMFMAVTPPGFGVMVNDIGYYNESTADPNSRLYGRGRTDFDRGYFINFVFGKMLFRNFTWANNIRYRDGEPLANLFVAEGLNQGPTMVQTKEHAQGLIGVGRLTYFMSWDTRFTYEFPGTGMNLRASLDIYNVLDARTELTENLIDDQNFRRPTEMISPRSFAVRLSASF